jgi:uncharacterized protein
MQIEKVIIVHPAILFRIRNLYKENMSQEALKEATRGVWRINLARANNAILAMAVDNGVIKGVFSIEKWEKNNPAEYKTRKDVWDRKYRDRKQFVGKLAIPEITSLYLGKSVRSYFTEGSSNPFQYVNC